jgi:hypothetical protein
VPRMLPSADLGLPVTLRAPQNSGAAGHVSGNIPPEVLKLRSSACGGEYVVPGCTGRKDRVPNPSSQAGVVIAPSLTIAIVPACWLLRRECQRFR